MYCWWVIHLVHFNRQNHFHLFTDDPDSLIPSVEDTVECWYVGTFCLVLTLSLVRLRLET